MFKLASKSIAFPYRCSLVKSSALKNMNRPVPMSSYFSTFNVPNNDQLDKEKSMNADISKHLLSKGKRFLGMICVAGGLIHFDLNAHILVGGGLSAIFGGISYHQHPVNGFNWASRAGASMLFAGLWQSTIINHCFDFASTFVTLFPSTMLLTATVFGASSLYARCATQVCAYRPAIVGTLAGMGMIAFESGHIVPNTLMTMLYTPEQLSLAYTYMCNTLPLLTMSATGATMSAIADAEDRYADTLNHNSRKEEAPRAIADSTGDNNKDITSATAEEKCEKSCVDIVAGSEKHQKN